MSDPYAELRMLINARFADGYQLADVLLLFDVREEYRDVEVTALADPRRWVLRHRWLVAEMCVGVEEIDGGPVYAELPESGDDDLHPGVESEVP